MTKNVSKLICATILVTTLLISLTAATSSDSFSSFPDAQGHWAYGDLRRAHNDGLLLGTDGYILPNEGITTAQALTVLLRIFDAQITEATPEVSFSSREWYDELLTKASRLGLSGFINEATLAHHLSRQDAFRLLAEAFQLIEAEPNYEKLRQFSDSGQILGENRQAVASLVSQGFLTGYGGKLEVNKVMTRASFVSVVYRIIEGFSPASDVMGDYEVGMLLQGPAELCGNRFDKGVWFDCSASDIVFDGITANSAVIRSHELSSLLIGGSSSIKRLTLATQSENVAIAPKDDAVIDTLVVGTGRGMVTTEGISAIEITGNNRQISITDSVDSVVVSGFGNTIYVGEDAQIGSVLLLMNARGSRVIVDGEIQKLDIISSESHVSGKGIVDTLYLRRPDTVVDVNYNSVREYVDIGLAGASLSLNAPSSLPVGNTLNITASIEGAAPGKDCRLIWFVDDVMILDTEVTTGGTHPTLSHKFEYSFNMSQNANVKAVIKYETDTGERQEISAESTVKLDNHSKQYWMSMEAPRVLREVTLGYKGDFTYEWAVANDLDDFDKEVWVNAKGYTSDSEYLLWINLAYQRVNIFKREGGSWALFRTCLVGTGKPGRGTPPGVWTTSYKQTGGWYFPGYMVRPVVRFRGSSGYAFHSRIYSTNGSRLVDDSIGFPVSLGCIRMYDDDIWFIHDNVPNGTTVVVH